VTVAPVKTVNGDEDTCAADVAGLVKPLDLKSAIHIGHSTAVARWRYVAQHGKGRVATLIPVSPMACALRTQTRSMPSHGIHRANGKYRNCVNILGHRDGFNLGLVHAGVGFRRRETQKKYGPPEGPLRDALAATIRNALELNADAVAKSEKL
jgi:hypothetical protein